MIIDDHHCGPPGTGNGGWVAGSLAATLAGSPSARSVRLCAPAPLGRELRVEPTAGGVELRDDDRLIAVATAAPSSPLPALPGPVDLALAREAASAFDHERHPFPGCYVCGSDRPDGLAIYPGPVPGRAGVVAAPFTLPAGDLPTVWAALDCPGAFAIGMAEGEALLLGTMTVEVVREAPLGSEVVIVGWATGSQGRKRTCGTALLDDEGTLIAHAAATWIAPA